MHNLLRIITTDQYLAPRFVAVRVRSDVVDEGYRNHSRPSGWKRLHLGELLAFCAKKLACLVIFRLSFAAAEIIPLDLGGVYPPTSCAWLRGLKLKTSLIELSPMFLGLTSWSCVGYLLNW